MCESGGAKTCHGSGGIVLLRAQRDTATYCLLQRTQERQGIYTLELNLKVRLAV